jgi:hypothetical protein
MPTCRNRECSDRVPYANTLCPSCRVAWYMGLRAGWMIAAIAGGLMTLVTYFVK